MSMSVVYIIEDYDIFQFNALVGRKKFQRIKNLSQIFNYVKAICLLKWKVTWFIYRLTSEAKNLVIEIIRHTSSTFFYDLIYNSVE